ncbi:MAG: FecR domain-containing protein [Acidobacteria bacterium]|nr:FecR domain-containing protein [Acidobacteriota bacterium]
MRAATLCLALAAVSLGQVPQPGTAWVSSLTGVLTVRRAQQEMHVLRVNDTIEIGDELTTGENSEATIRTTEGANVRIFPDSRILFSRRPPDVQDFLHLFLGSVKVYIEKISGRPNPHKMTTPTAIIAVRGTTFRTE